MTTSVKTVTTSATFISWKKQWQEVYNEELSKILSIEHDINWKKTGVAFLDSMNKIMASVLVDLSKIRAIFDEMSAETIMLKGIKNLVSEEYFWDSKYGIIRRFDENSHICFDPFVLETEMMAEFVGYKEEPYFFLNIRIYEDDSERIDFDLEYQTLEDIKSFEEHQNFLKNSSLRFMCDEEFEDEDEELEATGEMLKGLSEMKFNNLKDSLRWQNAFDSIELQEHVNDNGETVYLIQIYDKTISLTTITCDKKGWRINWGSSTPRSLKSVILNTMEHY